MKVSTLLLLCFLPIFTTGLLARPIEDTFSGPPNHFSMEFDDPEPITPNITPPGSPFDTLTKITQKALPPVFLVDNDTCGLNTGGVRVWPDIHTTGPWTYNWSTGATTQHVFGLGAGTYTVAITDANGNVQTQEFDVPDVTSIGPFDFASGGNGNTSCIAPFNGSITIHASNFPMLPPWHYEWSTGATTTTINGLEDGTYTVTITTGNTCESTFEVGVADLANSPTFGPQIAPAHCDLSDGGARLLGVAGVPPFTFLWANGNTNSFIQNVPGGDYELTVTGGNGCTSTTILVVPNEIYDIDIPTFNVVNSTTCIGGNGSIDIIEVTPNIVGYTYEWSTGATTQDINNLPSGLYYVTVTYTSACTAQRVFQVDQASIVPQLEFTPTNSKCGLSNGKLNLTTLPGGAPPYTYLWSNGATTQGLTNVPAGTYGVTVTGLNGCTVSGDATIADEEIPINFIATVTDENTCDTTHNGKIVLALMPNTLAYQWSNGVSSTTLTGLAPGNYTVTISAGGTCTTVETFNVGNVTAYPVAPLVPIPSTCGRANGGINLTVSAGVMPYTFEWSNGATTEDLNLILADTFYVTVTGDNGCAVSNQIIVPNVNDTLRVDGIVLDNISCTTPTGVIEINVTPLDTLYTFAWSNGATTDSLFNLTGGDYYVTVTLGTTCMVRDTFTISSQASPPNLSAASNSANCGLNNGSADLTITGGTGPFTFIWSTLATTEDLSNLTPGNYTVTVTGSNNCSATNVATVQNNNTPLNVNGTPAANTSCTASNGSIDIGVTPTGTYNYAWSTTATTEDLNNLPVGSYTVTVSLGTCLSTNSFTISDNALPPNLSSSGTSANCGLSDGAADLSISGGVGPFTYQWSNSATTEDLLNLAPGLYDVVVTGSNGCTASSTANVLNNNIALNLSATPLANTSCTTANGAIDITVAPAGTYTYLWSNTATQEDLSNLQDGTYTVTVTLGTCQSTNTYLVADNTATPAVSSNITAAICSLNNGAIDLSVSGPAGPYTYLWSNGVTDEDLVNILPANYSVTVTASNGCTSVSNLNVANNASNFSLAGTPAAQTDCVADNGSIDLNVSPAGAFTYLWSTNATTEDLSNLPPGTYTVSVTQSGSCTATASYFVLDQRTNPLSSQAVVPELCGQNDGSIDLSVNGGTTPYTYSWTGGQTTQDLGNLPAGPYAVTVTDANHCTVTANLSVPGNTISFSLSGIPSANSSCIQNNGSIDLTVNPPGGVSYQWSIPVVTEDISGLAAGTYTVTVSAGGTCTNTAEFTISSNVPVPQLSQTISAAQCAQPSGGIDLSVSGSPAPYGFNWSGGNTTEDLNGIAAGSYTVTVTAANGCTTVDGFTVPENSITPTIGSILTQSTSCVTSNGAIDLSITPAVTQGYTFQWSNLAVTEDLNNIAAGTYTVTVSAGGACTNTAVLNVGSSLPLPAIAENISAAVCGQASGAIDLSVTVGPTPYTFNWNDGQTTEDISLLLFGTYTVTVTAGNGCTSVESFTVTDNTVAPVINGQLVNANSCISPNGAIDLSVNFNGNYTVLWSNGLVTEDLSNLGAGSYTVTISGGGSCTGTASFNVADQTTQPQAAVAANTTALDCSTTSTTLNGSVSGTTNATSLQWLSNSAVLGAGNTLVVNAPGQYDLIVTDNVTLCTSSASINITQSLNPPGLTAANPAELTCVATSQTLTGSSAVPGVQFAWATIVGTDTTILGNGPSYPVSAAGTYFLIGLNPANNCANAIPVVVTANQTPPTALAGAAFTLDCAGETASLNGSGTGAPSLNYQWSSADGHFVSGANTASPQIDVPGVYELLVTNPANGCTDVDAVTITPEIPVAYASVIPPSCSDPQGTVLVDSVTGLSEPLLYSLNSAQAVAQNQFPDLDPGTYTIDVLGGNGCKATATVVVDAPDPVAITLTPEATINLGHSYDLSASVNIQSADIQTIQWTPSEGLACDSCLNTSATPADNTTYTLLVISKEGCEARGIIEISIDKTRKVFGPNIFSPDGDGANDVFTIFADPVAVTRIRSLQIYSRWGEEVFDLKDFAPGDLTTGWDGTSKGQKLNPAVFVWQAIVEFADGQEEYFKGDVLLQR